MAELLIMAVSATNANPTKDRRACPKRGDIIAVQEDGFKWGSLELLPPDRGGAFCRVCIPGVSVKDLQVAAKTQFGCELGEPEYDKTTDPFCWSVVTRSRINVLVDTLPVATKAQLASTGAYATTWNSIKTTVNDKVAGTVADGK